MPTAPRYGGPRSLGSVGRQSINVGGAFDTGRGLQQLGRGVSAIGSAVNDREVAAETEEAKRQKSANQNRTAMQKIEDDNYKFAFDKQRQSRAQEQKKQKGLNAVNGVAAFDSTIDDDINTVLKNVTDPTKRAKLEVEMRQSDLSRRNGVFTHENSERTSAMNTHADSLDKSLRDKMKLSASTLMSGDGNVNGWMLQFQQDQMSLGEYLVDGLGQESAVANSTVMEATVAGTTAAVDALIQGLDQSEAIEEDYEAVKDVIEQLEAIGSGAGGDVKAGQFDTDQMLKDLDKRKALTEARIEEAIVASNDAIVGEYTNSVAELSSDVERARELENFLADNKGADPAVIKRARNVTESFDVVTPVDTHNQMIDEVMLLEAPEDYEPVLRAKLESGEIGYTSYNRMSKFIDKSIDRKKKSAWADISLRLNQIKGGIIDTGAGEGDIERSRSFFRGDITLKDDFIKGWNQLQDLMEDSNVTATELNEIATQVFFKPESFMQMKDVEESLLWATSAFRQAAIISGTQSLTEKDIESDRVKRGNVTGRPTSDTGAELDEGDTLGPKKAKKVTPSSLPSVSTLRLSGL